MPKACKFSTKAPEEPLSPCRLTMEDLSEELRDGGWLESDEKIYDWSLDETNPRTITLWINRKETPHENNTSPYANPKR